MQNSNPLKVSTQEHVFVQWASFQAELAAFTFPEIGSISHFSTDTGPIIGAIATSWMDGLPTAGPFRSGWDYFVSVAEGLVDQAMQRKRSGTTSSQYSTMALSSFGILCMTQTFLRAATGRFTSTTWIWACRTFSSMTTSISAGRGEIVVPAKVQRGGASTRKEGQPTARLDC